MTPIPNSVRKLKLDVRCDSPGEAAALRARLADLNHARLIPVIERVLAEASRPGVRTRLERLQVDLGAFSPNEVEALAPARLYSALSEALRDAVSIATSERTESAEAAWIDILETYLRTGTLPFPFSEADSFSLDRYFSELAETQPDELASLVRRIGRNDEVLDRIVFQLLPERLRALVGLLAPADADVILAYMADIAAAGRVERITELSDEAFEQRLWFLVLTYLLQDPGSQFNRKIFVRSLLTGIANFAGVGYEDILGILSRALGKMMRRIGVRSSLPAVIRELVEEATPGLALSEPVFDPSSPDLAAQIREIADDRYALQRMVARLLPEEFRAVVRALEPEHAQLVLDYMVDVIAADRIQRLTNLDETNLELLLRFLVLVYLLDDPGSQFNRKSFVKSLLVGMAAHNNLSYVRILSLFGKALEMSSTRAVLRSSLPGIFGELLRESGISNAVSVVGSRALLSQILPAVDIPGTPMAQAFEAAISQVSDRESFFTRIVNAVRRGDLLDFDRFAAETNAGSAMGDAHFAAVVESRALLSQILPAIDIAGTPMAQAFEAAISQVSDRESFFARIVKAVRHNDLLDFDRFAAETNAVSGSPEDSEDSDDSEEGLNNLLGELQQREPRAARNFLRAWIKRSPARALLLRRLAPARFPDLLQSLLDQPSASLLQLIAACRQLPLADRPASDALSAAILTEVLRREPVDESPEFFDAILQAIFPRPLPELIRHTLATHIPAEETVLLSVLNAESSPALDLHYLFGKFTPPEVLVDRVFGDFGLEAGGSEGLAAFEALLREIEESSGARATELRQALRQRLSNPELRERVAHILPERALASLVGALDGNAIQTLLSGAALIAAAFASSFPDLAGGESFRGRALLAAVAISGMSSNQRLAAVLDKYIDAFSRDRSGPRSAASGSRNIAAFLRRASRLASEAGHAELRSVLDAGTRHTPKTAAPVSTPVPVSLSPRTSLKRAANTADETFYVHNAGLVLASPFLPHLFEQLEMLETTETGRTRWRDHHIASRAVHLTQYLVDGRTSAPEPRLIWNKLLCGLPPSTPVERAIDPSPRELEACDALLKSVLANWTVISGTSIAALCETFLQRQGKLEMTLARRTLQVQRKTVDVLLDQIPWSFRLVFHRWMPEPVYVTW